MNPISNIGSSALPDLASLTQPASGVAEVKKFEQTLANILGEMLSKTSSASSSDSEDSPVVPTGSDLMPLQMALILSQVKEAGK